MAAAERVCPKRPADSKQSRCSLGLHSVIDAHGVASRVTTAANTTVTYDAWYSERYSGSGVLSAKKVTTSGSATQSSTKSASVSQSTPISQETYIWSCQWCGEFQFCGEDGRLTTSGMGDVSKSLITIGGSSGSGGSTAVSAAAMTNVVTGITLAAQSVTDSVLIAGGATPAALEASRQQRLAAVPKPAPQPCADGKHVWEVHPVHKAVFAFAERKTAATTTTTTTKVNGQTTAQSSSSAVSASGGGALALAKDMLYCVRCGHAACQRLYRKELHDLFVGHPLIQSQIAALPAGTDGSLVLTA